MSFDGRMLANISVLAAIVHSGSFARAAEALGMSPSGVSRAVARWNRVLAFACLTGRRAQSP